MRFDRMNPKRSPHGTRSFSLAIRPLSSGSHQSIFLANLPKSFHASSMQPRVGRGWMALFCNVRDVGVERSTTGAGAGWKTPKRAPSSPSSPPGDCVAH